jgi:hypothetical protein
MNADFPELNGYVAELRHVRLATGLTQHIHVVVQHCAIIFLLKICDAIESSTFSLSLRSKYGASNSWSPITSSPVVT